MTHLKQQPRWVLILLTVLPYAILAFFIWDIHHLRFTDRFLVGTAHGHVGYDFYSVPRSFINLQHGQHLYDLDYASWYGPHATPYYYHPLLSIVAGSWLSLLTPPAAFTVFMMVIAGTLLWLGHYWSRFFTNPLEKKLVVVLTSCSFPVYLLLWNAQMHIFTIIAAVLVLTAVINMYNGKKAGWQLTTGLLFSLFSKPLLLLWVPALFIVPETRMPTIKAFVIYILVSALFFIVPFLQPVGINTTHWENIANQTARIEQDKEYFSFSTTFPLPLPGKLKNSLYLLIPLLLCISSLRLRKVKTAQQRLRLLLYLMMALLASYYFAYSLVWEYHYTTLLGAVPCILYLYNTAAADEKKTWKNILIVSMLLYLPTTYVLSNTAIFMMHLSRVLPVTILMIMLIAVYLRKQRKVLL